MSMDINASFQSTCRVLFGRDIGELEWYKDYLNGMVDPPAERRSTISGERVFLSRPHYDRDARFSNLGELREERLGMDDLKDIDSLLGALRERMYYCGGKNLGVSSNVRESDSCNDSIEVLSSYNVIASKNIAYSNGVRESENVFGCQLGGEIGFCMRSQVIFFSKRCFETYLSKSCNDTYFSFNCRGCSDCIFCFNQASKRCAIGNLELPRERYTDLKKGLLLEAAEILEKKKRFPSLFELADGGDWNG